MRQFYDQNLALSVINHRLRNALETAGKIIEELKKGDVMFVPRRVLGLASILDAEIRKLDKAIAQSKELTDEKKD